MMSVSEILSDHCKKCDVKCSQVMKSGLSVGEGEIASGQFSKEELRDLFTLREDTECETHDLLQCSCGGSGKPQKENEQEKVDLINLIFNISSIF